MQIVFLGRLLVIQEPPLYNPDGEIDIIIAAGKGVGPFVYEVTTSLGTQTSAPTSNRTHTFGGLPPAETISFTVTDKVNGGAGCEVSSSQSPVTPAAPEALTKFYNYSTYRNCASGDCDTYRLFPVFTSSGTQQRIDVENNTTISINGGPEVPILGRTTGGKIFFDNGEAVLMMPAGTPFTIKAANVTCMGDIIYSGVAPAENFDHHLNATPQVTGEAGSCIELHTVRVTGNLGNGSGVGGSTFTWCEDSHTVTIEQETPQGSGIWVSVPTSPSDGINDLNDARTDYDLPGPGHYRVTATDNCDTKVKEFNAVSSNPMSLDVSKLDRNTVLKGTGGFVIRALLANGLPHKSANAALKYPIDITVKKIEGVRILVAQLLPQYILIL